MLAPGVLSGAHTADTNASAALCRLLAFAEQIDLPAHEELSVESLVARRLLPATGSSCAAHLTYLKDFPVTADHPEQLEKARKVLRADPAFQQIDMNNATLGNPLELDLTVDECIKLQQTLNQHFAADGIHFESKDPHRWYCHFEELPTVTSTPVSAATGRDVARCRLNGAEVRQWRRKLAEIEMLLFDHPVNLLRQQNNKLPVNTLWLWGEGQPLAVDNTENLSVYSDNFYTQSVCEFTGVGCYVLPSGSGAITLSSQAVMIVIDKFTHPVSSADKHRVNLQWFDDAVCNHLWRQLKATALPEIVIWCGDNRLFRVRASVKKQLLRRLLYKPQPLAAYFPNEEIPNDTSPVNASMRVSQLTARRRR